MPGLIYKFENQIISLFEDNVKFMGHLPCAIYFDLEKTCGKKTYDFEKNAYLYPISYAFVCFIIWILWRRNSWEIMRRLCFIKKKNYCSWKCSCESLSLLLKSRNKQINEKFTRRYLELDPFTKQKFKRERILFCGGE